ncbi:hypothetical protein DYH10_01400 [Candidatus Saccharibacteria bacterium CPR2]|nr:hypothetical protein [Candidatus Saccharibacteria bacterium CPR2]
MPAKKTNRSKATRRKSQKKSDINKKLRWGLLITVAFIFALGGWFIFIKGKSNVVTITDNAPWMNPVALEIKPGETVVWKKNTPAVHPVMTLEGPEEFHSGHFTDSWSHKFEKPGIYVYVCPIHPYMQGIIGVGMPVPKEKLPKWANWPPENKPVPAGTPAIKGSGKLWVGAQFQELKNKEKPGTIVIFNTEDWSVERVIDDESLNNPHNLWQVGDNVIATNWFDLFASTFDSKTGDFKKKILAGESPAHIHANGDKIVVTLQGDDGIAILNSQTLEIDKKVRAPKGPHGHWMSADGKLMALASTEKGMISVWDTDKNEIIFQDETIESTHSDQHGSDSSKHNHSLPLMAGITPNGVHAFVATHHSGKFYAYNIANQSRIASIDIGKGPVQTVPSPDGRYVFVPVSGEGSVAVISTESWNIVKKIPNIGDGSHGVFFGKNQNGGTYAYVTNKFSLWVTVIDVEKLEVAGYLPMPDGAWGGQGVLLVQ